jgi:HemY protein
MLKALRFIIVAAVLLAVAWYVGNLPGDVTAHSGDYTVQTSVPAALLLLFCVALLFTILLRVLGGLRRAPGGFGSWRGGRRRKLGEIAVQRGLVALAAGDAAAAMAEAGRAKKLLGESPLVLLLAAESARLAGKTAQAQAAFEKLTTHKEMKFLGHRGLLRSRLAAGDHEKAAVHALAAEDAYPGSAWLKEKRLEIAVKQQNWANAVGFARKPAEVAAFATAAAGAADNRLALSYGKQAVKAQPELAPAVVAYAKALFANGKARAAKKALLSGWAVAPHPLIAQAYLEPVATPIERAQAAADLAAAKPAHPESHLVLAQTSLAANLPGEARRHAEAAVKAGSNDGRAAAILGQLDGGAKTLMLVPAAAPLGWVCSACHAPAANWQPTCPHCHRAGVLTAVAASA